MSTPLDAFAFTSMFVLALALSAGLRTWLALRQIRHVAAHRDAVPPAFADRIGLASHRRAAAYTIARTRLGLVDDFISTGLVVILVLFGGLQWLHDLLAGLAVERPMLAQIGFVLGVSLLAGAVGLPVAWYRQFHLERRFGFNRMTPALFIGDIGRNLLVGFVLGAPLLWAILALMRGAGEQWWIPAWLVWVGFNILVLYAYPTLIAPLFNRFEPLPAGGVRERVEALLARCGFASKGLFVMDGSKRSAHGNAYFTGFGRAKRIVFFDTLLARLDANEIEAVLAHELGHFRHRHVLRRMAIAFALSAAGLWLLAWLAGRPWFYQGLGLTPTAQLMDGAALVLFFIALPAFTFPLGPLASLMSRRDEFQADAFAASHADGSALVAALVKLYQDNASTLTPDPVHSVFYDSHPPAAIRIGRLREMTPPTAEATT
ncbi:MAG: M48 family metallopeptidase [Burkholderiaceae bacterium]